MKRIDNVILRGDRVRYSDAFLNSTEQFDAHRRGPDAPCHWGFNARGVVTFRGKEQTLCTVRWDDGKEATVLVRYLTKCA